MAVTENAHLQGILLACEEINATGGLSGSKIEPVILNPEGDDRRYTELAAELLLKHRVNSIFGCCLSTSRKAVLPIIERYNGVLFYPSVYEGFEYSPNVIYGGAVPNQMILPLLDYVFKNHGNRIALVGSDTLYAREINRIVMEFLSSSGGTVVGETYLPFGTGKIRMETELKNIGSEQVDVILSTVVGEDSVNLYSAYASVFPQDRNLPIASLTTTESELAKMPAEARAGHLSVASYFGSVGSPQNQKFVAAFKSRFGDNAVPGVYSEVCYSLVHFFANAAGLSDTTDSDTVLEALSGAVFKGPGGDLSIDIDTNHFNLRPLIGRSCEDGTFEIVSKNPSVVRADPYLVAYDRSVSGQLAV
ncbi:transporter substrate-binding domain-containing protein [Pelagibius sp. Alg239-R121]|uniref:transporter substrate-binding domain-containing protein n=1 Tax=Pelagibius sp. Alg239-R121 TaxID=2993448 RepID=UPI0024A6D970|nr:transporter substrate-binding domain-containing protein [Pelagibius sp. Alg239-R121]